MTGIIFAALAAITTPTFEDKLTEIIRAQLPVRMQGATYARTLATRIGVEAQRRQIDPVALAAIAWIESGFRSWVRGKVEVGLWQLIPGDASVRAAEKRLRGCPAPEGLSRYMRKRWKRLAGNYPCEAPEIAKHRHRAGAFSVSELKQVEISTYVAAFEIFEHRSKCIERKHRPHLPRFCRLGDRKVQVTLGQLGHYNSGSRTPRAYYLYKLCRYYKRIKTMMSARQRVTFNWRPLVIGSTATNR